MRTYFFFDYAISSKYSLHSILHRYSIEQIFTNQLFAIRKLIIWEIRTSLVGRLIASFKRSHASNFSCNVHSRNVDIGFYALDTILEKLENAHILRCIYSWTINGCCWIIGKIIPQLVAMHFTAPLESFKPDSYLIGASNHYTEID